MALIFPELVGLAWPVTKTPMFQTRIRRSTSGREVRLSDFSTSSNATRIAWEFTLSFDEVLRGTYLPGSTYSEVNELASFYNSCRGPFYPFFFSDPDDNTATDETCYLVSGTTTQYQLCRFYGEGSHGFTEAITAPRQVALVYVDAVAVSPTEWSYDAQTGIITFDSAPGGGAAVTASFTYWFRCRFVDDAVPFDEFYQEFHSVKNLKFVSALGDMTPSPASA